MGYNEGDEHFCVLFPGERMGSCLFMTGEESGFEVNTNEIIFQLTEFDAHSAEHRFFHFSAVIVFNHIFL